MISKLTAPLHPACEFEVSDSTAFHPRTWLRRNCGRVCDPTGRGQSAVEFAIALPVLLIVLTGIVALGTTFNQVLQLTYATNNAAQLLSISRGQTTDPCQTTSQAAYAAAPSLSPSRIKFTISLGGTVVASGAAQPSCNGSESNLVQSNAAQVTATYPCNLSIFGFNPAPNCTLSAQTTAMIQ